MKIISRNAVISFLFYVGIVNHVAGQASPVEVSSTGKSIDIVYNKIRRLTGGEPIVENINIQRRVFSETNSSFQFGVSEQSVNVHILRSQYPNVIGMSLSTEGFTKQKGSEYSGIFFSDFPDYKQGVTFYRYKPWNSWTKPVRVSNPAQLEPWDNQCFYWQYQDGTFGLAVPLCGDGFRTTLGTENKMFGSKAQMLADGYNTSDSVPSMVIGFGDNLYSLFHEVYAAALTFMDKSENLVANKKFPEPLNYVGWCTWNASSMGSKLSEEVVIRGVESFTKNDFPLGWVLIDDGWFDHKGSQLRSFKPDPHKFPNGFKPMITRLKKDFHLKHVGVWHALNGYWNGIDPTSDLGSNFQHELFSWNQKERVDVESSPVVTYHFIKPTSDSLKSFYRRWHAYLKDEGFSFLKVDNQLVVERMSVANYPIGVLADSMHAAMNSSTHDYFNNALINCMDMTADAYYNFGTTAVARSVEDYFPYEAGETYNLQRGNAAAHILQGIYNNLYFSPMVYTDLDMFQSHNPNGEFHAIARAINNGPIYVTDNPGEQNFEVLKKLVLEDGRILRSDKSLLPTQDCLFQLQDAKIFKAFSQSKGIGLLGVWNCADADKVTGTVSPKDAMVEGEKFAVYESFSKSLRLCSADEVIPVTLGRMDYQLYYVAPLKNEMAVLGLVNKYNAPATIVDQTISKNEIHVRVMEGGSLGVIISRAPKEVKVNGVRSNHFSFRDQLCLIDVPHGPGPKEVIVKLGK